MRHRIHRQTVRDLHDNVPRLQFSLHDLYVGLINFLHLRRHENFNPFQHSEQPRLDDKARAEQGDFLISTRQNLFL